MWQRYNQTSHIFEKSVDNGVSWAPLPLSGAIITEGTIPNVAYVNAQNVFTQPQSISHASLARILIIDSSRPADQKKFDLLNGSGNFYIRTLNDAETLAPHSFSMNRSGNLQTSGSWLTIGGVNAGVTLATGSGAAQAYIQNTTFGFEHLFNAFWNGTGWTLSNGAVPSWLLRIGGGGSDQIGIYRAPPGSTTFAGLFSISLLGSILERGRNIALGDATDFPPVLSTSAGTVALNQNFACNYTLIGKYIAINFYLSVNLSSTPQWVAIDLPAGLTARGFSANTIQVGSGTGMAQTTTGGTKLNFYRNIDGGGVFTAGANAIGGLAFIPVN